MANVVTRAWGSRTQFDPARGKLYSWVWKVSRNAVLDAVDDKDRRRGISGDTERNGGRVYALPIPEYAADDETVCNDTVDTFLSCLDKERDRRILLYLLDGLDAEEISRRENISINAARIAVFYLRRRLRGLA